MSGPLSSQPMITAPPGVSLAGLRPGRDQRRVPQGVRAITTGGTICAVDAERPTDDDSTTATGSATPAGQSQPVDADRAAWDAIDPEVRARLADFLGPEDFTLDSGSATAEGDWRRMNEALTEAEGYEAL